MKITITKIQVQKRKEIMQEHVIEMRGSTLSDRIKLKRVLEDNEQPIYRSKCNIGGIMMNTLWDTESELIWTKLAFSSNIWQNVNNTFTTSITIDEFIEKYKTL
jgi:hypothetical protein